MIPLGAASCRPPLGQRLQMPDVRAAVKQPRTSLHSFPSARSSMAYIYGIAPDALVLLAENRAEPILGFKL
jgi:hypothetical protein